MGIRSRIVLVAAYTLTHCTFQLMSHLLAGMAVVSVAAENGLELAAASCLALNLAVVVAMFSAKGESLVYLAIFFFAAYFHWVCYKHQTQIFAYGYSVSGDAEIQRHSGEIAALAKKYESCLMDSSRQECYHVLRPILAGTRLSRYSITWRGAAGCPPQTLSHAIVFHSWNRTWGTGFGCPEALGSWLAEMKIQRVDANHFIFVGSYHDQTL